MSSSFSNNNGLEKPATGDQSGTWGITADTNYDLIDESLDGVYPITLPTNAATYQITISQGASSNARNRQLLFSGSPAPSCVISIYPVTTKKTWFVTNKCSVPLVFAGAGSNQATVAANSVAIIVSDGSTGCVSFLASGYTVGLNNASVGGNLAVVGQTNLGNVTANSLVGGSGGISTTGTISASGNLTAANVTTAGSVAASYIASSGNLQASAISTTAASNAISVARPGTYNNAGVYWGVAISNSGGGDSVTLAETGPNYAGSGPLGWAGNSNAYIYYPGGTSELRIGTGTGPNPTIALKGNQNVIIGSASDNGTDRLQVAGNISSTGALSGATLSVTGATNLATTTTAALTASSLTTSGNLNCNAIATGFVNITSSNTQIALNTPSATAAQATIALQANGTTKWQVGKNFDNSFFVYSTTAGRDIFSATSDGGSMYLNATTLYCGAISSGTLTAPTINVITDNVTTANITTANVTTGTIATANVGALTTTGAVNINNGATILGTTNLGTVSTSSSVTSPVGNFTTANITGLLGATATFTSTNNRQLVINNPTAGQQSLIGYYDAGSVQWLSGKHVDNSFLLYSTTANKSIFSATADANTLALYPNVFVAGGLSPTLLSGGQPIPSGASITATVNPAMAGISASVSSAGNLMTGDIGTVNTSSANFNGHPDFITVTVTVPYGVNLTSNRRLLVFPKSQATAQLGLFVVTGGFSGSTATFTINVSNIPSSPSSAGTYSMDYLLVL